MTTPKPPPAPSAKRPQGATLGLAARPVHPPDPPATAVTWVSYGLMATSLLLIMLFGLLPGLLSVCVGFMLTRWLAPRFGAGAQAPAWRQWLACAVVIVAPLLLLALALSHSRNYLVNAPHQYQELLNYIGRTILELREKLPSGIASQLPDGAEEVQRILADYVRQKAGELATTGRAWLSALLHAYAGLLIGALSAVRAISPRDGPLSQALRTRIARFGDTFRQIVTAQFWIASFNTLMTAIFLLLILPLTGYKLPYTPLLIILTFVAGLIPIVGNLLCNGIITVVALSVSLWAAVACLAFLVLIHKAEYVINAKVVGARTHMGIWELLAIMFAAEAIFGAAGLVAAPLFYAYLKRELESRALI